MTELGNKQLIEAHKWLKERAFEKEDVPILLVEYARIQCEKQRQSDLDCVEIIKGHYPTDIFPEDSKSSDAIGARMARITCDLVVQDIKESLLVV